MVKNSKIIVRKVGEMLINNYINGEHVVGGINGPYDDPETSVRNLSHLAIISSIEILKYGQSEYISTLKKIGTEILSQKGRDNLWVMRDKATKDSCNGVIGHAWLIEALIYVYMVLHEDIYINEAITVARLHKFDAKLGLWKRPTDNTVDYTMNHQLWYAASLAELNKVVKDAEFGSQLEIFMEKLSINLRINKNGRIRHSATVHDSTKETWKQKLKNILSDVFEKADKPSMAYKEEGYHVFNLFALARLYQVNKAWAYWKTDKFKKSMGYILKNEFFDGLENHNVQLDASLKNQITDKEEKSINIYGYPYNVPGFEVAYVAETFKGMIPLDIVDKCIEKQMTYTYDPTKNLFGLRSHDKQTINYRVYEFYRFLETEQ